MISIIIYQILFYLEDKNVFQQLLIKFYFI